MAKTDDKVMQLVERELEKNPDASVDELYDKAAKADKSVEKLTKRQFNARYPLQVKRRKAPPRKKRGKKKSRSGSTSRKTSKKAAAAPTGHREAVRATFMKFASDMASAEARKDLVKFLAGVDAYVDEVLSISKK